jgi:hypothetical protein
VHVNEWNTQDQQRFVWPPSFALARAYLDQLERSKGLTLAAIASARSALTRAEQQSADARKGALTDLASQMQTAEAGSSDQGKVHLLSSALTDLANAQR